MAAASRWLLQLPLLPLLLPVLQSFAFSMQQLPLGEAAAATASAAADESFEVSGRGFGGSLQLREDSPLLSVLQDPSLSPGLHNVLLLLLLLACLAWLSTVLPRLTRLLQIRKQLSVQPEALFLSEFGVFKDELQQLMRLHFEKLLQGYKPAAPVPMPQIHVKVYAFDAKSLSHGEATEAVELLQQQQQACRVAREEQRGLHCRPLTSSSSSSSSRGRSSSSTSDNDHQRELLLGTAGNRGGGDGRESFSESSAPYAAAAAAAAVAGKGFEVTVDATETANIRVYWGVRPKAIDELLKGGSNAAEAVSSGATAGSARSIVRLLEPTTKQLSRHSSRSSSKQQKQFSSRKVQQLELESLDARIGGLAAEFVQLKETPPVNWRRDDFCLASRIQVVPPGRGHRLWFFTHDPENVGGDASLGSPSSFPVVVVSSSLHEDPTRLLAPHTAALEASCHLLLLRCRALPLPPPSTSSRALPVLLPPLSAPLPSCFVSHRFEVYRQLVCGGSLFKPQEKADVFGVCSPDGSLEADCLVCMTAPKDIVLYPCRHCTLCSSCLLSLHHERCPVCRSPFFAFISFPLRRRPASADPTSPERRLSAAAPAAAAAAVISGSSSSLVRSNTGSSTSEDTPHGQSRVFPLS